MRNGYILVNFFKNMYFSCILISSIIVVSMIICHKIYYKKNQFKSKKRHSNNIRSTSPIHNMCLSLVIPATIQDLNRCSNVLVRSICNSVKFPDEVVLVVSGVSEEYMLELGLLVEDLEQCTNSLVVKYRKNKHNAASNRNYGYLHSHCPILSYFDVDDIMSKYRISTIYRIFNENKNIDVVFHPSMNNYKRLDKANLTRRYRRYAVVNEYKIIRKRCLDTYKYNGRVYECDVSNGFYITNGWPSIKRDIMNKFQFNETLRATEDLDFISRVVAHGYKVALFKRPLGFYIKDFSCNIS